MEVRPEALSALHQPHPCEPLPEAVLRFCTKIDQAAALNGASLFTDGEAEIRGGFIFSFPADAQVAAAGVASLKGNQANWRCGKLAE